VRVRRRGTARAVDGTRAARGASAVEYSVTVMGIAGVLAVAVLGLGDRLSGILDCFSSQLSGASSTCGASGGPDLAPVDTESGSGGGPTTAPEPTDTAVTTTTPSTTLTTSGVPTTTTGSGTTTGVTTTTTTSSTSVTTTDTSTG
jgi:Flp pilus assembly pilin Flp